MPRVMVSGRGGSGKSTLVALLARGLGEQGRKTLVVDADESNLSLDLMLNVPAPEMSLMDYLGGKPAVRDKLMAAIRSGGGEQALMFDETFTFDTLPCQCVSWKEMTGLVRVGKIEHSHEGCACPMGALARNFLKQLQVEDDQWLLVDTEAGVEHFGRGVLDGVEMVLMTVDPSYESVMMAEKTRRLAGEGGKYFMVVLNKSDEATGAVLRRELEGRGVPVGGTLSLSPKIAQANLVGNPANPGMLSGEVAAIIDSVAGFMNPANDNHEGG
jgi:CO dehydrogenase maturation factor